MSDEEAFESAEEEGEADEAEARASSDMKSRQSEMATGGGASPLEEKEENEQEEKGEKKKEKEEERPLCAVCLEEYRRPKLLPCFHTFCQSCLHGVAGSSPSFPCPSCRTVVLLPPGGVPALQSNFYIEQDQNQHGHPPARLCDMCPQDTEAEHSCLQCHQSYCGPCRTFHDSITSCRTHTVVGVQVGCAEGGDGDGKGGQEEEPCPQHKDQAVVLHCVPCRANICLQCKLTTHDDHPSESLRDAGVKVKARLRERLTALSQQTGTVRGVLSAIEHRQDRLGTLYSATERGVRERVEKVKEWVDQYQDTTLAGLHTLSEDALQSLSATEQGLQHTHAALTAQAEHIARVLQGDKDADIVELEASLKDVDVDQGQMARMVSRLQADPDPYTCRHNAVALNTACLQEFVGILNKCDDQDAVSGSSPGQASGSSTQQTHESVKVSKSLHPSVRMNEVIYASNPNSHVLATCVTSDKQVWIKYQSSKVDRMALFGRRGLIKETAFVFPTNAIVTVHDNITIGSVVTRPNSVFWINPKGAKGKMEARFHITSTAKTWQQTLYVTDYSDCWILNASSTDFSEWTKTRYPRQAGQALSLKDASRDERFVAFAENDGVSVYMTSRYGTSHYATYCPLSKEPILDACFFPVRDKEMLVVVVKGDNQLHVVDHRDRGQFAHYLDTGDFKLHSPHLLATDQETVLWVACDGGRALMMEI